FHLVIFFEYVEQFNHAINLVFKIFLLLFFLLFLLITRACFDVSDNYLFKFFINVVGVFDFSVWHFFRFVIVDGLFGYTEFVGKFSNSFHWLTSLFFIIVHSYCYYLPTNYQLPYLYYYNI